MKRTGRSLLRKQGRERCFARGNSEQHVQGHRAVNSKSLRTAKDGPGAEAGEKGQQGKAEHETLP